MGYAHIDNLYKEQTILLFRECWALEKIHGTSAHLAWSGNNVLHLFSGGEKPANFAKLFDEDKLKEAFRQIGRPDLAVYGEAYGGSQQGQSYRYGKTLKFVVFDVQVITELGARYWLPVPMAHEIAAKLGLEFVHYERVSTDLDALNAQRDAPSEQARRNGVEGQHPREGVVLRPILEAYIGGSRVIAKHKRDEERETRKQRPVVDPAKLEVLTQAAAIAEEWVTPTRMQHVLSKLPAEINMEQTKDVIAAMVEDVLREGSGEFIDTREARAAIGTATAKLFRQTLQARLAK